MKPQDVSPGLVEGSSTQRRLVHGYVQPETLLLSPASEVFATLGKRSPRINWPYSQFVLCITKQLQASTFLSLKNGVCYFIRNMLTWLPRQQQTSFPVLNCLLSIFCTHASSSVTQRQQCVRRESASGLLGDRATRRFCPNFTVPGCVTRQKTR